MKPQVVNRTCNEDQHIGSLILPELIQFVGILVPEGNLLSLPVTVWEAGLDGNYGRPAIC